MIAPKVAISKEFLKALSELPRAQQKKVREFAEKFQRDPTQPGINFEKLGGAVDDKVRSVRIDKTYRAIVIHPPRGDVYLLVWVDHHDDAYDWVRNKRFEVNPSSGTLQLFETIEGEAPVAEPAVVTHAGVSAAPPGLFDRIDDEDLLFAGVPQILLETVRRLRTEAALMKLSRYLPEDAAEVLIGMAAGYTLLEAIEEAERKAPAPEQKVDVDDFAAALERPESQRMFAVVEDEKSLEEMLDAPLEQWRVFLHPSQRRIVEMEASGPFRVLGGAGTGKTVALMHRARHLAARVFTSRDDRILVTTYTRNLALDLRESLRGLCGEEFSRIDVTNLHSWAVQLLRRQDVRLNFVGDPEKNRLFGSAAEEMDGAQFSIQFLRDEWDLVVLGQGVRTRDEYLTTRRIGRATRLGKRQRAAAWSVFSRYRELLKERGLVEWDDAIHEARLFLEKQGAALPYRAVLTDETQDLSAADLRLIRALVPAGANDLFLAGDAHQRIYGHRSSLRSCGIEVRGRSRRLRINYRTTEEIRNQSVALLQGVTVDDLDDGSDSIHGYVSLRHGPAPEITHHASESDEATAVVDAVRNWLETVPAEGICIAARENAMLRDRYATILETAGIPAVTVTKDAEATLPAGHVRLATMHRMKGLEFRCVLVAGVHKGKVPLELYDGWERDDAEAREHEIAERCLFYVACTRARDELVVTGYGEPSPFLEAAG